MTIQNSFKPACDAGRDMTAKGLVADTDDLRAMLKDEKPGMIQFGKMAIQLPSTGKVTQPLVATDRMWVVVKAYASDGENEFHTHPNEDHVFLVLQGKAQFASPDGEVRVIGRNEIALVARGTYYRVASADAEPLVMVRVGALTDPGHDAFERVGLDGKTLDAFSADNRSTPVALSSRKFE